MSTLKTTIKAGVALSLLGSTLLGGAPSWAAKAADDIALDTGTAASKADLVYAATLTIAASGNTVLNLADASLVNEIGETLTFVKVKAIYIAAASGNTNKVQIGGAASTQFVGPFADVSDKVEVKPGGRLLVCDTVNGWTVGSGVSLKLANSSGTTGVTFDIIIVGTSA